MGEYSCILVTVLYGEELLRCAVKIKNGMWPDDVLAYPMEPDTKAAIHAILPAHVRSCGPVVAVEEIFEIHSQ